jgi:DNA repair protein RadC
LHYISHVTGNQALHHQAFPDNILHISIEDLACTKEIVQAGKLLDCDVLDHLIIGAHNWVSLKERGLEF